MPFLGIDLHVVCLQLLFKYNSLFANRILLSLLHTSIRLACKWFKPQPKYIVDFTWNIKEYFNANGTHTCLKLAVIYVELYNSSEIFLYINLGNPSLWQEGNSDGLKTPTYAVSAHCTVCTWGYYNKDTKNHFLLWK